VRLVEFERGQSIVFMVQVSKLDNKYCVHDILYKFSLPERPKISKVWENYPNFYLEYPILVRPMSFHRGHIIVL
jgi:hypothetical protein